MGGCGAECSAAWGCITVLPVCVGGRQLLLTEMLYSVLVASCRLSTAGRPCQLPSALHTLDHTHEGSLAWRSCRVTGLTLSKEQLEEATTRVKAAGLQDRVTLMFCDYRDCPGVGTYDKVGGLGWGWTE